MKKSIYILLLVLTIIKLYALLFPKHIESMYSNGLYLHLASFWTKLIKQINGSIGDAIYCILLVYITYKVYLFTKKKFSRKSLIFKTIVQLIILYIVFLFNWGLNYSRIPLSEKEDLAPEYTWHDLENLITELIFETNLIQETISKDSAIQPKIPYSQDQIRKLTAQQYQVHKKFTPYEYPTNTVKESLFSTPLSYMGFGGYLNPFTLEAHVNTNLPKHSYIITCLHEIAHQMGYASENEANFIAYWHSQKSDDIFVKFAGKLMALRYCLRNADKIKPGYYENKLQNLNSGVLKALEENEIYAQKYSTPLANVFDSIYDIFLKANQQTDGVETYQQFVGLMIDYEKSAKLNP